MKYIVKIPCAFGGRREVGEELDITEKQAEEIGLDLLTKVPEQPAPVVETEEESEQPEGAEGEYEDDEEEGEEGKETEEESEV